MLFGTYPQRYQILRTLTADLLSIREERRARSSRAAEAFPVHDRDDAVIEVTAQALLEEHTRRLRLPVLLILSYYPRMAQSDDQRNLTDEGILLALLGEEMVQRDQVALNPPVARTVQPLSNNPVISGLIFIACVIPSSRHPVILSGPPELCRSGILLLRNRQPENASGNPG